MLVNNFVAEKEVKKKRSLPTICILHVLHCSDVLEKYAQLSNFVFVYPCKLMNCIQIARRLLKKWLIEVTFGQWKWTIWV